MKRRSCGCGKRLYRSWIEACSTALRRTRRGAPPLRIYPCPTKAGWHLTKLVTPISTKEAI